MNSSDHLPEEDPVFGVDSEPSYTLETVVDLAGISTSTLQICLQRGVVTAKEDASGKRLDDAGIRRLRQIASIQNEFGIDPEGAGSIIELLDELESLRKELRFYRDKFL